MHTAKSVVYFSAMQGIRLHREYNSCEDKKELLNLCEKLGDFYHEIKVPEKALEYYLQQVRYSHQFRITVFLNRRHFSIDAISRAA